MVFMVTCHGRESRRASFQDKDREPCTPVLPSLAPQADTEAIAQPGHGDLLTVYSPFFQSACQCLLFHTLLPSEILDYPRLSTPGNSCTCFPLAVQCCCRGFSVHQGSGRTAPHLGPLLCPEWQNLAEKHPLAPRQEQLQLLITWHFEKRKYFEILFLFPHWDSKFPEERV